MPANVESAPLRQASMHLVDVGQGVSGPRSASRFASWVRDRFRSFGFRLTLLAVVSSAAAVFLVSTCIVMMQLLDARRLALDHASTHAAVISTHSGAALAFDDRAAAAETLAALKAVPAVEFARIYKIDGTAFADYLRASAKPPVLAEPPAGLGTFEDGRLILVNDILHRDEVLGKMALVYNMRPFIARSQRHVLIAAVISGLGIAVSYLLAMRLRRGLERPIANLVSTARRISETRDYSARASMCADDELGHLTAAFNQMLDRIHETTRQRDETQERQKLLLAELNHRVKNTLATVQSIVTRSSCQDGAAFQAAVNGRLRSLAQTHSLLTKAHWKGVDLRDMLASELSPYAGVRIQGPKISLSPRSALSLQLVIHELATNAAKYGSLSCPDGKVCVRWGVDGSEQGRRLGLHWQESGGPRVTQPTRSGFGTSVIKNSVEYELEGRCDVQFAAEGLRCQFFIPWSAEIGSLNGSA